VKKMAPERAEEINRCLVSPLGSVVTRVTQLSFYKSNYLEVLQSAAFKYRGLHDARQADEASPGTVTVTAKPLPGHG